MARRVARYAKRSLVLGGFLLLTACYHTITTTNLPAGPVTKVEWATAFIYGLVPAKVDAAQICRGKPIQAVETQASLVNMLVGWVTFGIFTPMTVQVTCAG